MSEQTPTEPEAPPASPGLGFEVTLERAIEERDVEFATEIMLGQSELRTIDAVFWLEGKVIGISPAEASIWYEVIQGYATTLLKQNPPDEVARTLQQANSKAAGFILGRENRSRYSSEGY